MPTPNPTTFHKGQRVRSIASGKTGTVLVVTLASDIPAHLRSHRDRCLVRLDEGDRTPTGFSFDELEPANG